MAALQISDGDVNDWLSELKPYQRDTLQVFLLTATPEEAAERWLSSTGSPNIVPFGGPHDSKPFWNRFKEEFRKFVCDDQAYIEERRSLVAQGPVGKAVVVSMISATIGATIGYSATLLAPAVALLLCAIGKMGVNAYCSAG